MLDLTFDDGTATDVSGNRQGVSVDEASSTERVFGNGNAMFDGNTIIRVANSASSVSRTLSLSRRG